MGTAFFACYDCLMSTSLFKKFTAIVVFIGLIINAFTDVFTTFFGNFVFQPYVSDQESSTNFARLSLLALSVLWVVCSVFVFNAGMQSRIGASLQKTASVVWDILTAFFALGMLCVFLVYAFLIFAFTRM